MNWSSFGLISSISDFNKLRFKNTPRIHNQCYSASSPCYDFYPRLLRKLGSDYVQVPVIEPTGSEKKGHFSMDTTHTTHQNLTKETFCEIQRSQQDSSVNQWDLYPGARDVKDPNK